MYREAELLMSDGGFNFRKWNSNSLLAVINSDHSDTLGQSMNQINYLESNGFRSRMRLDSTLESNRLTREVYHPANELYCA